MPRNSNSGRRRPADDGATRAGALIGSARIIRRAEGSDTMLAWERFLTGDPHAATPAGNFVVSSWQRSLALGVNPCRPRRAAGRARRRRRPAARPPS